MSIEHVVEELLSAYLDNALTQEEYAAVATHLQTCSACNAVLADFRRFDTLLAQQIRVSPSADLRERIFTSPEYLELIGENVPEQFINSTTVAHDVKDRQTLPQKRVRSDDASRPRLVALPAKVHAPSLSEQARIRTSQRRNRYIQRFMQVMIAACLLFTFGVGSFIGWNIWQEQGKIAHDTHSITPPQSPHQGGPLPAGMRFVFLRDGSLWSTPEDGSMQAVRLTPTTVTVAQHWAVIPAPSGHNAGNLLAYVDTKQGYIHIIRTDGQSDTIIQQLLLQNVSASSWNTPPGKSILDSLSWSPDGHTLAFIGATARTSTVYTYSTSTNQTQSIALSDKGTISHLVWSPNGVRIAFGFTHNSITSIFDYNVLTREVLTVIPKIASIQNPNDTLLTLDWTPMNDAPALTWSVGKQGHIHSIWRRYVGGVNGDNNELLLSSGDYTQAVYDRHGEYGSGSWLLSRPLTTNADTLLSLSLTGAVRIIANGIQIGAVQWAQDGTHITYFDSLASGVGTLHSVDTTSGINTLVAHAVHSTPAPTWSVDGQHLLYSSGTHSLVADIQNGRTQLPITGTASTFTWSITSLHTAIIALQDGVKGIYLVDTQRNVVKSISTQSMTGPIVWTQVP
ncbi:MAG: hypothetical protein NVS4B1_03650 [Ktedonobacteraceae bacterium]